jgi:hypothetical protein
MELPAPKDYQKIADWGCVKTIDFFILYEYEQILQMPLPSTQTTEEPKTKWLEAISASSHR